MPLFDRDTLVIAAFLFLSVNLVATVIFAIHGRLQSCQVFASEKLPTTRISLELFFANSVMLIVLLSVISPKEIIGPYLPSRDSAHEFHLYKKNAVFYELVDVFPNLNSQNLSDQNIHTFWVSNPNPDPFVTTIILKVAAPTSAKYLRIFARVNFPEILSRKISLSISEDNKTWKKSQEPVGDSTSHSLQVSKNWVDLRLPEEKYSFIRLDIDNVNYRNAYNLQISEIQLIQSME